MSSLNSIDPSKRALLQKLMRQKAEAAATGIPRVTSDGPLPLSFGQQRLWFLDQFEPESTRYNLPIPYRLKGKLDIAVLEASFRTVIARHGSLRTTFPMVNGEPVQQVAEQVDFTLARVDVRDVPEAEREEQLLQMVTAELDKPFDLANGPLLRVTLYQVQEDEYVLLTMLHHIISDGWSNAILISELGKAYAAHHAGETPELPELKVQFADVSAWQRERFDNGGMDGDLSYWKTQLAGAPALTELPLDFPRPVVQSSAGRMYPFSLSKTTLGSLEKVCREEGVTVVMAMLALFNTLLHRYSGAEDMVIAIPVLNRQRAEMEPLIGYFANTVAIRTSLDGSTSFRELLKRVRVATLGAFEHQELPYEKLVEVLQPERDPSYSPIAQVALMVTAGGSESLQQLIWPDVTLVPYECEINSTLFDLTLQVDQRGEDMFLGLQYRTELFTEATIARLAHHVRLLLEGALAAPETPIAKLPMLTEQDRHQLLVEFNDTEVVFDKIHVLHHLIEEQVERTPDRIAVSAEGKSLTFRELNSRANQLAHHLRTLGAGPEILIGLSVERSLEMMVGLLGILKSGSAFVPMDPSYPKDRIAYMLEDANVPVLLTQEHLLAELPEHGAHVICLDRDWATVAKESDENPESNVTPDHLAYMIYTSGSTGKPKGAMNNHRGIVNRVLWMQSEYQLNETDKVMQKTPISFDVSCWEFFWPLTTGVELVMARPEGHKDATYLVELIQSVGITTLHFVPSMLRLFLLEPNVSKCLSLRRVILDGEALTYDLQERFFELLPPPIELHNLYGPTEAAVDVTYWACQRGSTDKVVPIGRPMANTQMYILDADLQPMPIGVAGELHIGGVQVGRGYRNREELTAEKFIVDPFSTKPGARLYKTGDSARYRADGTIEFLGRIDNQVKLRGLRIELGEIESNLKEHQTIGDAVVIVKEIAPGDQRLVAYYTAAGDTTPDVNELRTFLGTSLPEYMVPQHFVLLDAIPLTPNGKMDRKQLPSPELTVVKEQAEVVPPKNETERLLAEIWKEVLHVDQVGTRDHFFEIGGHSLLVAQVRQQVNERLNAKLTMLDMFRFTTIQALAKQLSQGQEAESSKAKVQPVMDRAARQREAMMKRKPGGRR